MSWLIFLIASASVFLFTVCLAVAVYKRNSKFGSLVTPVNTMFAGVFVSAYVIYLPLNIENFAGESSPFLKLVKIICINFYKVLQTFSLDGDFFGTYEQVISSVGGNILSYVYLAYISILFVVAPMITFSFIILIFRNILSSISYHFSFFRDLYIFSDLNERSLLLAEDIRKNHPKAKIIYADANFGEDGESFELLNGAKQQRAICFKTNVDAINLSFHSKRCQVHIFLIGKDETDNSNKALSIIKRYGDRDNTNLYVFCKNTVGSLILSSPKEKKIKLRRIDESQSLIYRHLYEDGVRFFNEAVETQNGEKTVGAVVVGMGGYGSEMIKALSWFCQMDGYSLEINAFDKDEFAEDKFIAKCPELMSPSLNGKDIEGEARYNIKIHPKTEVATKSFYEKLSKIERISYVLVSLGDDELNIQTATELRTYFEARGIKPTIQAVVNSYGLCDMLEGVTNFKKQEYKIEFIGSYKDSYTESVVISSEIERDAMKIHRKYGDSADNFWRYDYNYRSSIASAIHNKVRIALGIKGAGKREDELTAEEKTALQCLEHRRWNAYMRSQGYSFSGSQNPETRNDLGKLHHDLVSYDLLDKGEQLKDLRVATEEAGSDEVATV